ncbi:membrane protein insertase YidC [Nitrosophilus labii]|uniref:membrane protein insertase YidC n=1 Tax=Nitrosophilus labii TaxID=2706014 RepID=UPI001657236F|nr:membrane protein insertase YidC [Nitrosophilus labii]
MFEKMDTNQRVIIATVLSLGVFLIYDYFFMPKSNPSKSVQTQKEIQENVAAPKTNNETVEEKSQNKPQSDNQSTLLGEELVTIDSKHFTMKIDNIGRIKQVVLKDKRFVTENGEHIKLFNDSKLPKPLEIRFSDEKTNLEAFKVPYVSDKKDIKIDDKPVELTLTQNLSNLKVVKKIKIYPDGHYDLKVNLSNEKKYFISPGFRPDVRVDGYTFHGVLIKEADNTITMIDDGDAKGIESFRKAKIAAAVDRYYSTFFYDLKKGLNVVISKDEEENPIIFVEGEKSFEISGYLGPKDYNILKNINPELTDVIEYGFFTFIAKPMFKILLAIYNFVGNWGWAIVILTILIRILLFPLTFKGMVSMQKLKDLSPKIKELQQKYKGDPQKLNAHMMQLYKKHGANPMGGCLPLLLQIPVFFAIYRVLLNAIELKGAEWILWIKDLSVMDPYFILPILMGITMYIHQKITPTTITDPMQQKIFQYLPIVFTFFFITFPAGLTLYWFVNNILSIIQQIIVNKAFESKKAVQKEAK